MKKRVIVLNTKVLLHDPDVQLVTLIEKAGTGKLYWH